MADWLGRVWEKEIVKGRFSNGGFWAGRVWGGRGGSLPTVTTFSPATGSVISAQQLLTFRISASAAIQRVQILVQFTQLDLYEVAFDGEAFSPAYPASLGNVRNAVALTNDFTFAILRKNGWPASPRMVPVVIDDSGNLNLLDETIYAWTLI